MVRPGLNQHVGKRRAKRRFPAAVAVIAMTAFIALLASRLPASSSVGVFKRSSAGIRPWVENQDYDPAAASFYSLLSFGP